MILAGVYDIKNLKQKIRPEEEHRYNSPWNVAADFPVDMSFSPKDIAGMLAEYVKDNHFDINIPEVSQLLYDNTSGYPYLVSRICKLLDEQVWKRKNFQEKSSVWCRAGVIEAVKQLLQEPNTLFDDMLKKIADSTELRDMLYAILFRGKAFPYNPYNHAIAIGSMFGFIKEERGVAVIANRIFEMHFYNLLDRGCIYSGK